MILRLMHDTNENNLNGLSKQDCHRILTLSCPYEEAVPVCYRNQKWFPYRYAMARLEGDGKRKVIFLLSQIILTNKKL